MKRVYVCPHCRGRLNPNVKIILKARRGARRGLFLFSPKPGNYGVIVPEGFGLREGEPVFFACPICDADLTSKRDRAMAEIRFVAQDGTEGRVVFSRSYGHHETYVVTAEEVRSYGEHAAAEGLNFWGAGPSR